MYPALSYKFLRKTVHWSDIHIALTGSQVVMRPSDILYLLSADWDSQAWYAVYVETANAMGSCRAQRVLRACRGSPDCLSLWWDLSPDMSKAVWLYGTSLQIRDIWHVKLTNRCSGEEQVGPARACRVGRHQERINIWVSGKQLVRV